MLYPQTPTATHPLQPLTVNYRCTPEHTIRRTYARWMQRFPRWVKAGFTEEFLLRYALPRLRAMLAGDDYLTPTQLAQIWVTTFGLPAECRARTVAESTPVIADFLMQLQVDYCAQ
jgi:hypothetical protein